MNLAVRKSDFVKIGGFDSHFWPGEDTKLCLDLTHKLGKQIVYDPKVLVYHHRRPLLFPHLRQNGNFGLHRGFFARILPETSFKLIYFLPSLLILGLFSLLTVIPAQAGIHPMNLILDTILTTIVIIGLFSFSLYFLTLFLNSLWVFHKSKDIFQGILSIPVIFITHLWYGARFLQGFFFITTLPR